MPNPLIGYSGLPPFNDIRAEHVVPAIKQVLATIEERLAALEKSAIPTWEGTMQPLEEMSLLLQRVWGPITHLNVVKNSPELRQAYEAVQGEVVTFALKLNQSNALYRTFKAIKEGPTWKKLSEAQRRILDARILDAELSGIALEGEAKKKFNDQSQELSRLSNQFANNVLDATKQFQLLLKASEDTVGLPQSFLNLAAQAYNQRFPNAEGVATAESGPWLVTLDAPSLVPFLENSKRRDLREKLYRAHSSRASEGEFNNSEICRRLLQIRKELAQLLGFSSYAEMSLRRKMAPSVASVYALSEELREAAWQPALKELADLKEIAQRHGSSETLAHWDMAYWAKRLQEERFEFTDEELRPYFPLPEVLTGLFSLVRKLFGIEVQEADGQAPVWHKDVRFFKIFDEAKHHIASFYLDPYTRPENKRGGAWMDDCMSRHREGGKIVLPVAYLVCNSTPPVNNQPSLLTFREVETLFHEFGHGLQHMLTRVEFLDASGINGIEWDAIECPSQFMENWCYHKETLLSMAKHFETKKPLPESLYKKLLAAKTFRAGQLMLRQLQFGLIDLKLHDSYDPFAAASPLAIQKEIAEKMSVIPPLAEDRFLCSFSHIFAGSYAAGYYSYKWAEVLSADAFGAFEEAGLDKELELVAVGRRFRDTILALGGSKHPMEVFKLFRGREPNTKALLRHSGLIL